MRKMILHSSEYTIMRNIIREASTIEQLAIVEKELVDNYELTTFFCKRHTN